EVGDRNIDLIVDTSVIDKFAAEAQVYSEMFSEVQLTFQRLSTVNDTAVLRKIRDALLKISLMYENVQKFKASITATSVLQIPDSIKTVSEDLLSISESIECTLPYLEFFADPETVLTEAQKERANLNDVDKASIASAVNALNVWLDMIRNEANVYMSGNAY